MANEALAIKVNIDFKTTANVAVVIVAMRHH